MSKKILQIMPVDGLFFVVEKRYSSYGMSNREVAPNRYKVRGWALVAINESYFVEPLILADRGLILMPENGDWKIEAT